MAKKRKLKKNLSNYQKLKMNNDKRKVREKCLENIGNQNWEELEIQTTKHKWLLHEKLDELHNLQAGTVSDLGIFELLLTNCNDEIILLNYIYKSEIFYFNYCLYNITSKEHKNTLLALVEVSKLNHNQILSNFELLADTFTQALSDLNFEDSETTKKYIEFINPYRHLLAFLINIKKEHEFLKFAKEDTVIFAFRRNPDIITSYSDLKELIKQAQAAISMSRVMI
jgi:hypothetical protein